MSEYVWSAEWFRMSLCSLLEAQASPLFLAELVRTLRVSLRHPVERSVFQCQVLSLVTHNNRERSKKFGQICLLSRFHFQRPFLRFSQNQNKTLSSS